MSDIQHEPAASRTRNIRKQRQRAKATLAQGLTALWDRTLTQALPQLEAHAAEGHMFKLHIVVCNPDGTPWEPEGEAEGSGLIRSPLELVRR